MRKSIVYIISITIFLLISIFFVRENWNFRNREDFLNKFEQRRENISMKDDAIDEKNKDTFGELSFLPMKDIPYKKIFGVESNLLSLDVYPSGKNNSPIMIGVHGGGFMRGDKKSFDAYKPKYFNDLGFVYISVNYRLSPKESDFDFLQSGRITYLIHQEDVASALAWVYENADTFGGDRNAISLLGHSAGSGIVSLLATDKSFVENAGVSFSSLRCAILLDGDAYDIADKAQPISEKKVTNNNYMYLNAFATEQENAKNGIWKKASPLEYVKKGFSLPYFFIVTRGSSERVNSNKAFEDAVIASENYAEILNVNRKYTHEEISDAIGDPKDIVITKEITDFLLKNQCK